MGVKLQIRNAFAPCAMGAYLLTLSIMQRHYLTVDQQTELAQWLGARSELAPLERLALDQLRYLRKARKRQERFFAIEANRLEHNRRQAAYQREKNKGFIHGRNDVGDSGKTMCGRVIFGNTTIGQFQDVTCKTCLKAIGAQ